MYCPKCDAEMKILDYSDEPSEGWIIQVWECKCPECNYHGNYREFYKLDSYEWERIRDEWKK